MLNPTISQQMIVSAVCGQNAELTSFIQSNINALWCSVSDKCASDLKFYKVQLSAVEAGLAFTRNKIDETHSKSESVASSQSDSKGFSDAQGQGTNQGTSCGYSTAVSLAQTRADSRGENQSATDALSHGETQSQSHAWDRGNSTADGYSQSYANSIGGGYGDSFNYNVTHIVTSVHAHTHEDGPGPLMTLSPGQFPSFSIAPPFFSDPELGDEFNDPGYNKPPPQQFTCGSPDPTRPNYGQWFDGSYNVEISTPLFDAGASWDVGADFDQVHIITTGCDDSSTNFITEGTSEARSQTDSIGTGLGHSESFAQQDAHARASGQGDSRSDTHSSAISLNQGDNESHSETDSEGRSEAQNSSQSTAWGKSHSEMQSSSESRSNASSDSIMWSQIFANLNELWKRTFKEIKARDKKKSKGKFQIATTKLATIQFNGMSPCGPNPRSFTPRARYH